MLRFLNAIAIAFSLAYKLTICLVLLQNVKEKIMARIIKDICKIRDIMISGDDKLISSPWNTEPSGLYERTSWKLRDVIKKKVNEPDYELDITSQDLRELAKDIKAVLKRWEDTLDAETNIKWMLTQIDEKRNLNLQPYIDKALPTMIARVDSARFLLGLLNIVEYMAVYLYMLEINCQDKFALKFTERLGSL
jgi:hypothetical protein